MNLTDALAEVVVMLQSAFLVVVDIIIWIGVVVLLAVIVIGAIRLIGRVAGLPTEKMFECARAVMEQKFEQVKEKGGKQEPFRLEMLGIKIRAEGLTGRIIFIALLGSIAAAGASIDSWIGLDWMAASEMP